MAAQINPVAAVAGLSGIARRLVAEGVATEADMRKAIEASTRLKLPLATYLSEHALVNDAQLALVSATEFGLPVFDLNALDLSQAPIKLVSEKTITQYKALPLFKRGNRLFVGISDPTHQRVLDEIKFQANLTVEPILVQQDVLERAIDQALNNAGPIMEGLEDAEGLENLELGDSSEEGENASSGIDANGNDDAPVVRFINKVLIDAIKRGASDIHFEPYENTYRVRFRMDGILRTMAAPPIKMSPRISSRLKVMSGLDIAEKRIPQDGRIKLNLSKTKAIDFRASTCPTLFGEKVVLRILDAAAAKLGIDKLGYEEEQKKLFLDAIDKPYGMVLVTGPTGSGKNRFAVYRVEYPEYRRAEYFHCRRSGRNPS